MWDVKRIGGRRWVVTQRGEEQPCEFASRRAAWAWVAFYIAKYRP